MTGITAEGKLRPADEWRQKQDRRGYRRSGFAVEDPEVKENLPRAVGGAPVVPRTSASAHLANIARLQQVLQNAREYIGQGAAGHLSRRNTMQPAHDYAPGPEILADIYAAYLVHIRRRRRGNTAYTQAARSFLRRWPQVQQWADLPLDTRLAANCSTRPFISFLMVSRRLQPGYDYLLNRKLASLWHELTDSCLERI